MGFYLNPPADGFESLLKTGLYVDKTELIAYTNQVLGSDRKLLCVSRPRRFGKTSAARMLEAYYSKGADSRACFKKMKIGMAPDFEEHLNRYDVLSLDSVVIMAYLSSVDYYEKFQELSSGKGYVDILFLPRRASEKPALIVELKWNKSAKSAVAQIKARNYTQFLKKVGIVIRYYWWA